MRFDDRLATVLAQTIDGETGRQAVWRQLTDLLAQAPDLDALTRARGLARLREWRPRVPEPVRRSTAAALAWQALPPDLVLFFAEDLASIAAPVIGTARADDADWARLIPQLSPAARALLRHRRDLGPEALRALQAYGPTDLMIAPPARETAPPPSGIVEEFRFETDVTGMIRWCDLDTRGAVIGLSIAAADEKKAHGVDGHAAGAFRRRSAFRNARLTVAGEGAIGGAWRISAVPGFDPASGRFEGYRGHARRPRLDEQAEAPGLFGTALPGESLRQLAHEIRTPLNAIVGFAEMIDRQILGPVNQRYRDRVGVVLSEASALLSTVDDLETAARLDGKALRLHPKRLDGATLLAPAAAALHQLATARDVAFGLDLPAGLPALDADPASVERMVTRLVSAALGLAGAGEAIAARLYADGPERLCLSVTRPAALQRASERDLLDPGLEPNGDWPDAPVLGLGFTLRLVRGLAEAAGGALDIRPDSFELRLRAASPERATG